MKFKVLESEKNIRVDLFLSQKNIGLSRSQVKKIIQDGLVFSENRSLRANYLVQKNPKIPLLNNQIFP